MATLELNYDTKNQTTMAQKPTYADPGVTIGANIVRITWDDSIDQAALYHALERAQHMVVIRPDTPGVPIQS